MTCQCTSPDIRRTGHNTCFCGHCGNVFVYEAWLHSSNSTGATRLYIELYEHVEAYLCTPNTSPAIKDAYDKLVAWFMRNKRPDGTEPRPVSPEQEHFL